MAPGTLTEVEFVEVATLGGGCFWGTDAAYSMTKGVVRTVPGYMGGTQPNPTYQEVCTGQTGHAEVVQITFDPAVVSDSDLLEIFWKIHNPTQLNRQGFDIGSQYRSVIFHHSEDQNVIAERSKAALGMEGIVTEIRPAETFYAAADMHHNYFKTNRRDRYCQEVLEPMLRKFRKDFWSKLSEESKAYSETIVEHVTTQEFRFYCCTCTITYETRNISW